MRRLITSLAVAALAMSGLIVTGDDSTPDASAATSVTVAAVGDIACRPPYTVTPVKCQHAAVARLVRNNNPAALLALGDQQYEAGTLSDFMGSYDKSWGVLKSKTFPVPGNHEYYTGGAAGYYRYFGARAHGSPGYYAFNVGSWRVYALNSNCTKISCSTEAAWLRSDLAANPRTCVAAFMHHPRWSSGGEHGNNPSVDVLWRPLLNARADVMLAGHDHDYERFARMGLTGRSSSGMRLFVSGLGGKSLYPFGAVQPGSQLRYNSRPGALLLTLSGGAYSWKFKTVGGAVRDSGSDVCVA